MRKSEYKSKFEPGNYTLRVKRSKTGLGLFTAGPVTKGACIIEYTGRVLPEKEHYTSRSKYLFEVGKNTIIDGSIRTNTARYINHACVPNCEIEIIKGRVLVMAKKNIKAGEELFYDYDTEYFDTYIKPIGCKCAKHLKISAPKKAATNTPVAKKVAKKKSLATA